MANNARIVHAKTARATTGSDTQRVYGTDWNADHILTGLENVDNTSDDTKNAATATLTNKTIDTAGPNTIKINGNTLSATAGTATVTVPNSTDTLVGRTTTDTLTNKTLTAPSISGATITTSTYNGNTLTTGTGTLTLGAGKTATISNTLTFTGMDASSVAFGAGGAVAYQGGTLAQFAATTSAQLAGVISDETGSGALVFATSPSLTTPSFAQIVNTGTLTLPTSTDTLVGRATTDTLTNKAISGGTADGLTSLGVRTSGTGAFDLKLATSDNLTAARTLTVLTHDVNRQIDLNGGITIAAGGFATSGGFSTVLTATASTNVTLPTTGTLATLAGAETLSNKTLVAPALGTPASGTATNLTGLPLSGLTAQAAYTIVANNSGSSAIPTAVDITALTSKPSPVSADIVLIQDSAASNAFKKTTVGALSSAGSVASFNGRTGAVTATGTDVPLRSYLSGLTLSTDGSSSSFGAAIGVATDSTNSNMMSLASAMTKTTGSWAAGSGNGALDTGTAAGSWYHVFLIKRPDTGTTDILISISATSPTLPANYTMFRRIGSMYLTGSLQWRKFSQRGDEFLWDTRSTDLNSSTSTAASDVVLDTPYLVPVNALCSIRCDYSSAATSVLISSKDESDQAPSSATQTVTVASTNSLETTSLNIRTNNLRQIRVRSSGTGANLTISTYGWIDRRGRDD